MNPTPRSPIVPKKPPAKRPDGRPHTRRSDILEAAVVAITENGRATSMNMIAAAAGVSKPVVYQHFNDKADLVNALAEQMLGEMVPDIVDAIESDRDPDTILRATIAALVDRAAANKDLFIYVADNLLEAREIVALEHTAIISSLLDPFVASLIGDRDEGRDASVSTMAINLAFHHVRWWLLHGLRTRDQIVDDLSTFFLHGINGFKET